LIEPTPNQKLAKMKTQISFTSDKFSKNNNLALYYLPGDINYPYETIEILFVERLRFVTINIQVGEKSRRKVRIVS
jgi:hypothetical protein